MAHHIFGGFFLLAALMLGAGSGRARKSIGKGEGRIMGTLMLICLTVGVILLGT